MNRLGGCLDILARDGILQFDSEYVSQLIGGYGLFSGRLRLGNWAGGLGDEFQMIHLPELEK
jgi:hypothetical protein